MRHRKNKKNKSARQKLRALVGIVELDKILAKYWQMRTNGTVGITELQNQVKNETPRRNKKNKEAR